jgi:hypothetical protein
LAFASACRKAINKWYFLIGPLGAEYAVPLFCRGQRRRIAALVWVQVLFATVTSTFFLPSARSQQAGSPPEVYVGVIVTRTAEDAQAVLNELKAGMVVGVLAKEKSIDPSSGASLRDGKQSLSRLGQPRYLPTFQSRLALRQAGELQVCDSVFPELLQRAPGDLQVRWLEGSLT